MCAAKTLSSSTTMNALEINNLNPNSPEINQLGYEQAFKALEQIVASMESGQLSLEDALEAYKRGNTLLEHCQQLLAVVEQQVKILNDRQQLAPFNNGDVKNGDE